VGNKLTGMYIIQKTKQFDRIKIVGEPLYVTEYVAATTKDNQEILALLNQGLKDIKESGEYDRIYRKWFGEIITDNSILWKRLIVISSSIIAVVLGIAGLIYHWNRSLKRIVDIRTRELEAANKQLLIQQLRLEQSNRLRGKILENILDGIIVLDKEGSILGANAAAKELFQLTRDEGKSLEDLKPNIDLIMEGYDRALGGAIWKKSLEWQKQNGEIINIDCKISPMKDPDGIVEDIIIVLHDYTESRLLNEAKEYDKLKNDFFANMSHELRTPLSIILAAAQLLELKARDDQEKQLKNHIFKAAGSIKQNINRLTRLVNNIVDVTKADTGFLQLDLKNFNIVSIVEEVTMSTVNLIQNKGISIEFDTDVEEKIIACDIDKIEKVILNLLSNSVKFTPNNGSIFVNVTDGDEHITISVRDTGIGIPKDKQKLIFERFRQVDKSISRGSEGSGIGLSLVKSLVELHGGTIGVESCYGHGSEFIIHLPVVTLPDSPIYYEIESFNTEKTQLEFSDIYL